MLLGIVLPEKGHVLKFIFTSQPCCLDFSVDQAGTESDGWQCGKGQIDRNMTMKEGPGAQ